jgi:Na+/proline symporter
MLFGGLLKLFIPILVMVPGLAARARYPHLADADSAVPNLIRDLFPPGLLGLMFAAFFAALMSSVDSYLNSASTLFMSDLYGPAYRGVRRREVPRLHGLILGRCLTAVLIVSAGLAAPLIGEHSKTIYVAIQTLLSLFQGPTLAILLLGILWRRANGWGALAGLFVGLTVTTLLTVLGDDLFPAEDPFLFVSLWSFLVALAVTMVVSLCTPRQPDERIRGLVYGSVMSDDSAQELLHRRVDGP